MAIPTAPDAPLTPEVQAAALWTYIQVRTPRFTSAHALAVIGELQPQPGELLKHLAKRLRPLLERRGVRAKHAACLEAAARLQGHPSWHEAEHPSAAPHLRTVVLSGDGNGTAREEAFSRWQDLAPSMAHWCDERRRATGARVFEVHIGDHYLMVGTPVPRGDQFPGQMVPDPLFTVRPEAVTSNWLDGAPAAIEFLRRHLEECGTAVLDGAAVLQLCHKYSQRGVTHLPGPVDISVTADVANTELVLLREDNELNPASAFEIARGDEMTCWAQFEMAIQDHDEGGGIELDGEAWRIGAGRYVWELSTIRPKEYVPGLAIRRLNEQDAERLLRRYRIAKNVFSGRVRHHEVGKRVEYLGGPQESYRVDLHRVLTAANKVGHTWESMCAALGCEEVMRPELPTGFIMSIAKLLAPSDPNQFFARPNKSEMVRADDDRVLRALLPRVDTVRYRLGNVPDDAKPVIKEAISEVTDSLRLRTLTKAGMFANAENELPQLVYSQEGEDLRLKLEEHGLALYAAVLPALHPLDNLPETANREGIAPFAFGHMLYLHIEPQS